MDEVFAIYGLMYPAFNLWYRRAEENTYKAQYSTITDPSLKERVQKNVIRANKRSLRWIKYFCVICVYIATSFLLSLVLGDFFLFSLARVVVLFFLVREDAQGASFIFDMFSQYLQNNFPFMMRFAFAALDDEVGIDAQFKMLFSHSAKLFKDEYYQTLSSIELQYPH